MKVFLSWSGARSKAMAEAMRVWLRRVIQTLDPFMSAVDIAAGEFWSPTISAQLAASKFAIVCVTAENVQAPWLNYEAGALAEKLQGRTAPWLLGMDPSHLTSSPMSRLQANAADRAGTFEILEAINTLLENKLPREDLKEEFELKWPQLEARLTAIPEATQPVPKGDAVELAAEAVKNTRLILDAIASLETRTIAATLARHLGFEMTPQELRAQRNRAAHQSGMFDPLQPQLPLTVTAELGGLEASAKVDVNNPPPK